MEEHRGGRCFIVRDVCDVPQCPGQYSAELRAWNACHSHGLCDEGALQFVVLPCSSIYTITIYLNNMS